MNRSSRSGASATAGPVDGSGLVAGIDVGGTKALALICRTGGQGPLSTALGGDGAGHTGQAWRPEHVVARVEEPTSAGSPERLVAFLDGLLEEAAGAAGARPSDLRAVTVGLPGMVDPVTGHLRHAVNLGVGGEPLDVAGAVGRRVAGPVTVENDVNLAALGAAVASELAGDVAFLSIGTGLALGLVYGGRIHHGARGAAGEIGHVPVVPDGRECECGQRGCLETVASGRAIARAWRPGSPAVGGDGGPDAAGRPRPAWSAGAGDAGKGGGGAASALLVAASSGDPDAMAAKDKVFDHLAWTVTLIGQLLDPDVIVLGGGVADAGEPLLAAVQGALERRAVGAPFVAALDLPSRLQLVPPGLDAGAVGAVTAARSLLAGVPQ